ncbi:RDD family protein [Dethiobacter alkaliphilus]|uniref:RDD domain containing protein n=1 Tax=Dethiobacter alkaliphilus AHT 1 TaxID=555088 RepID=C0GFL0_DETAL|nr:RDD family protein [Dethiobacter alkaliphilus]EEG77970.1 RDD domain containing protein [Dethiobacter alkaliphilus AHT 1]
MQQEYKWLSPEKVYLNLELAGLGSRFAARFIDGVIQVILIIFVGVISFYAPWDTTLNIALLFILVFAVMTGYFIFFETFWNGQTPGKRIIRIRVVQSDGSAVTFVKVLIRNIIRIIDQLPFSYAIGMISVFVTKSSQRLGDMAAGTIVVKENIEEVPKPLELHVEEMPWTGAARLNIHKISENEFAVLKKYLLRRSSLSTIEKQEWDHKLTLFFREQLGLSSLDTGPPLQFLQQVAALYQNQ